MVKVTNIVCVSGIFYPPVKGTYAFTLYVLSGNDKGWVYLRKNDNDNDILCRVWVHENTNEATACSSVVRQNFS